MFVGSLRKAGFAGDVALSVSPEKEMKRHVAAYLKNQHVLAYPFKFTCGGPRGRKLLVTPGGCVLDDWYRDRDARGPRPLAISRYEMYETWLRQYSAESYVLDLDTRDTFFQADPFLPLAARRSAADHAKDLYVFEEDGLKTTGTCKWNKGWLRCFEAAKWHTPETWTQPVRCSGSTLGSRDAMLKYVDAMLSASDEWLCHRTKGIPSDQGYHNYLILSGAHARNGLRVVSEPRGSGVVHTIGAMNGNSVPMELLGPLDTKWKVRDPVKGFITNTDGSRSPVVHQWDRWAGEMKTLLTKAFATDSRAGQGRALRAALRVVAYDPKTCADHPFKADADAIFSRLLRGGDGAGGGAGWNDAEYEGGGLFGMPPKLKQKQKREGAAAPPPRAAAAPVARGPRGRGAGPGRAAQQRRPDGERQRERGARGEAAARPPRARARRRPSPPRRRASATRRGTPRGPKVRPDALGRPAAASPARPRRESTDRGPRRGATRRSACAASASSGSATPTPSPTGSRRRGGTSTSAPRLERAAAPRSPRSALSPSARRDECDDGDKENPPCDAGARVVVRVRPLLPHEAAKFCAASTDLPRAARAPGALGDDPRVHDARGHGAPAPPARASRRRPVGRAGDGRRRCASGARPCVDAALDGGVAALFMFGQTGSGKTHTMAGFEARVGDAVFGAGSRAADLRYFEVRGKRALDLLRKEDLRRRDGDDDGALHFSPKPLALSDDVSASPRTPERSKDSMYHDAQRRKESAEINQSLYALKQCIRVAPRRPAADAASDDRGKVVPKLRTDPGVARPRDAPAAPPLPPYPKAWAPTRLAAFFAQKLGLRGAADKVLDVKLDGKAASRMSAPALASLKLDGDAARRSSGASATGATRDRLHEIAREKRRRANRGYQ
ncbi:hypothetical protein JL720_1258 [Aureococcus anophagefferens]|nr:hypothetical protein JL720_1258 [Aureococcus anophagefferens]